MNKKRKRKGFKQFFILVLIELAITLFILKISNIPIQIDYEVFQDGIKGIIKLINDIK